ncbi:MAG: aminodeoxychorismate lyase [Reinekea sp.]
MEIKLFNGRSASIPVDHRALAFGDGIFETCLCIGSRIVLLTEHLVRMQHGAQVLHLEWSESDMAALHKTLLDLVSKCQANQTYVLKIMLLRSCPGRGYDYDPNAQQVDTVIQLKPYQAAAWQQSGATVLVGSPISENPVLAGVKHLNRLDSVLAKARIRAESAHEMLMVDQNKRVIEGTMSNLFVRRDGNWTTPPLKSAGVAGIIRQAILRWFPQITEQDLFTSELEAVQSAFLCNSLLGMVPINSLNHAVLDCDPMFEQIRQKLAVL